jgi:glutamate decarboxylase
MVHLVSVASDKEVAVPTEGLEGIHFEEADDFSTDAVYGTRYAACDLPKVEMPEREMPKEVAYRMIK